MADVVARDTRLSQYIQSLAVKPNHDPMLEYEPPAQNMAQAASSTSLASIANEANPEADSYGYIENVLEALAVLGHLGSAMERMSARVTAEIRTLIDATLEEVEERIEQRRSEAQDEFATPRLTTLEMGASPQHAAILRDLFWTLYSKLAAVLEAHRIVYEVARWISSVSRWPADLIPSDATLPPSRSRSSKSTNRSKPQYAHCYART
jgi:exocyst complex component 4